MGRNPAKGCGPRIKHGEISLPILGTSFNPTWFLENSRPVFGSAYPGEFAALEGTALPGKPRRLVTDVVSRTRPERLAGTDAERTARILDQPPGSLVRTAATPAPPDPGDADWESRTRTQAVMRTDTHKNFHVATNGVGAWALGN